MPARDPLVDGEKGSRNHYGSTEGDGIEDLKEWVICHIAIEKGLARPEMPAGKTTDSDWPGGRRTSLPV
jgi:hypothetical protein